MVPVQVIPCLVIHLTWSFLLCCAVLCWLALALALAQARKHAHCWFRMGIHGTGMLFNLIYNSSSPDCPVISQARARAS